MKSRGTAKSRSTKKSKSTRSAHAADRSAATRGTVSKSAAIDRDDRIGGPALVVAILLIGAIVMAVGFTVRAKNRSVPEYLTPTQTQEMPSQPMASDPDQPAAGDPSQAPATPENPASTSTSGQGASPSSPSTSGSGAGPSSSSTADPSNTSSTNPMMTH